MGKELEELDPSDRDHLYVAPLPRNLHPERHKGRRRGRTAWLRALLRRLNREDVYYVDVASYRQPHPLKKRSDHQNFVAVVIDKHGEIVNALSFRDSSVAEAETRAIALAIHTAERKGHESTIVTDSQAACRLLLRGRIPSGCRGLIKHRVNNDHTIFWCPAHAGLEGNERADAAARALTFRAQALAPSADFRTSAPSDTYNPAIAKDLLAHQRFTRQVYAPPDKRLTGEEAINWRKIQTGVYPHLKRLHAMFPTCYRSSCPWCGGSPTLYHITWGCSKHPPHLTHTGTIPTHTLEQWEARLSSSDLADQQALIDQVERAAKASGALD